MTSFAQNSQNAQSPVDRGKIILNLLDRIDAAEGEIIALEERRKALEEEIARADFAQLALTDAHKKALLELGELRATISFKKDEVRGLQDQVALWQAEAKRLGKELKASRKRELFLMLSHVPHILKLLL